MMNTTHITRFGLVLVLAAFFGTVEASAQGVGDILSGELVESAVGDYAWYEVKDSETGARLFLRQAVVGAEKVRRRDALWVETEIIPEVGYPVIYKMLLTGSASDPKNIHKLLIQELPDPPEEVPVDQEGMEGAPDPAARQFVGKETVPTEQGAVEADHYQIQGADGTVDIWLNEQVKPLGIVQMRSTLGEMKLQRYGQGGPDGESSLGKKRESLEPRVEVRGPTTNFSGRSEPAE